VTLRNRARAARISARRTNDAALTQFDRYFVQNEVLQRTPHAAHRVA